MDYKSIKIKESSYDNLLVVQYLLLQKRKVRLNKCALLDLLILRFRLQLEVIGK